MPNWVKTIVKTKPETLKDIMEKYSDKNKFSFDKVIPLPNDLDIESGSSGEQGMMYLFADSTDDLFKLKINEAFKEFNVFHSDIYRDGRFKEIEENLEKFRNNYSFQECIKLGRKYVSNFEKYGHCTWYNWCVDNWGTKWDLSEFSKNNNTMVFRTAWGFAGNVILKLSEHYPESIFECRFADEGNDDNSGSVKIQDGEVIEERYGLSEEEIATIWGTYFEGGEIEQENTEIEMDI